MVPLGITSVLIITVNVMGLAAPNVFEGVITIPTPPPFPVFAPVGVPLISHVLSFKLRPAGIVPVYVHVFRADLAVPSPVHDTVDLPN